MAGEILVSFSEYYRIWEMVRHLIWNVLWSFLGIEKKQGWVAVGQVGSLIFS